MGLAICKRFAQLMRGKIWAESSPGAGSTFFIELPFETVTGQQKDVAEEKQPAVQAASKTENFKLLIAEDDQVNATTLLCILKKIGYQGELARNGSEALALWRSGGFDAILMDINMPVMDGERALSILRKEEQSTGGHIPIIALTAHAMQEDQEKFLAQGFDGYIPKPVQFDKLDNEIVRLIMLCRTQQIST